MTLFAGKSDIDLHYMKQALAVVVAIVAVLVILFIHTLGAWLFMCSLVIAEIYFFYLVDKELYRRKRAAWRRYCEILSLIFFVSRNYDGTYWLDEYFSVGFKHDMLNRMIAGMPYKGKIGKGEWTQFREYEYCDGLKKYGLETSKLNLS